MAFHRDRRLTNNASPVIAVLANRPSRGILAACRGHWNLSFAPDSSLAYIRSMIKWRKIPGYDAMLVFGYQHHAPRRTPDRGAGLKRFLAFVLAAWIGMA